MKNFCFAFCITLFVITTVGCSSPWNDPHSKEGEEEMIFHSSFSERPKHLDPVSSYSENEARFNAQIYEPVVQYHYTKTPYQLVPLTGTELPSASYFDEKGKKLGRSADSSEVAFTVYEIEIRKGILFQPHPSFAKNGSGEFIYQNLSEADLEKINKIGDFVNTGSRELVAEDYVYQIKRLVHPKLHSPVAGFMGKHIIGLSKLADALRVADSEGKLIDLREFEFEGAKATGRYKFEIKIKGKYPQFKYWLAMSFFAPVPWEAEQFYSQKGMKERNLTFDWYPVGTGPFMLTENNPNRRIVLKRNPNYRVEYHPADLEKEKARRLPLVKKALFSLEKESIPEWTKFLQGYYDTSGVLSDSFDQVITFNSRGDFRLAQEMVNKGIRLEKAVKPSSSYMGFNMTDPVVGGYSRRAKLLRQAISIAVDYEELLTIFANGRGLAAQGPIPPGIFGYVAGEEGVNKNVYDWIEGSAKRKSEEVARSLLAEAGYPDGRELGKNGPLTLYYDTVSSGPGSKAILNWYRKQFKKLGIELVVRATDYNRFQEKIRKGTAQIFSWGWNADYPDPENFLFLLYGPNSKIVSQGENAVNYQNDEYDRLFALMRVSPNGPARQRLINRMVEILREDAPWLWGFHPTAFVLSHGWVSDAKPNLMARNTLKYRGIDTKSRAEMRKKWNKPVVWPIVIVISLLVIFAIPAVFVYRQHQGARIKC